MTTHYRPRRLTIEIDVRELSLIEFEQLARELLVSKPRGLAEGKNLPCNVEWETEPCDD